MLSTPQEGTTMSTERGDSMRRSTSMMTATSEREIWVGPIIVVN